MTPEQNAQAKAAGLERNPTDRAKALRDLDSELRAEATLAAVTALSGQDCRVMSRKEYATFTHAMGRALRGLPPR